MEDIVRQALTVMRGMWRFRWTGVIAAWVVAVIGVIIVSRIPDQYEASARIYVDTQSILKPLMAGLTVQPNVEQQIGMLSRTLISRPNLEKLVRMSDLDLKASTRADQDALIDMLMKQIAIKNTGRDNLYSLEYRDSDREKAKKVVQSLVSIFIESGLGASRKDNDSAKTFLSEQIKQYEAKLQEAESRMKEFRLRNIDMQASDGKDAASRVGEIAAQLQQAQLELREAENESAAAKAQLAAGKNPSGSSAVTDSLLQESEISVATPEIDARIEAQKRNLDSLQQRYTDQHPDIIAAKRLIKELEEQKRKEVVQLRKTALATPQVGGTGSNASLATQELSRLQATAEVKVAALKARVAEYSGRLAQARSSLKTAPQIEAEAAQLNRDYEVTKKNYQDLVARQQSAVMSGELEVAAGVADFRLIDPPRVTPQPVAPNRLLLLPIALVAALAAGLGIAFAACQLMPVFSDGDELRTVTGLPLLGVVSMVINDVERRRERLGTLWFAGASGGLVGLFALGMVALALIARRAG
ncbi:MAG: chain length-determining protein [Burkholderiales bacterium]|nr:chain length-determining protein [Burkholderiales bacterium]